MTVEQFAQMQTADREDYELVDGELIPLSSGTPRHNKIRDLTGHLLWLYFKANPIGEAYAENDCRTGDDTVRRPDVSVFLGERLKQIDRDKIPAPFAPDIAVEVLSASESAVNVRRRITGVSARGLKQGSVAARSPEWRDPGSYEATVFGFCRNRMFWTRPSCPDSLSPWQALL